MKDGDMVESIPLLQTLSKAEADRPPPNALYIPSCGKVNDLACWSAYFRRPCFCQVTPMQGICRSSYVFQLSGRMGSFTSQLHLVSFCQFGAHSLHQGLTRCRNATLFNHTHTPAPMPTIDIVTWHEELIQPPLFVAVKPRNL